MSGLDNKLEFFRYFTRTFPLEININKEDIFYRDKYNEIINYIKVSITDQLEDLEIYNYVKPKGMLLININPGTDILDFLKLISNNYYLTLFELRSQEILKNPEEFYNVFKEILFSFLSEEKEKKVLPEESEELQPAKEVDLKKRLILINQHKNLDKIFDHRSFLTSFLSYFQNSKKDINFIDKDSILVWINYDYEELMENSEELNEIFDLIIKVPVINEAERETVLRNFSERNPKIVFDINAIVNETDNWEVKDLNQLLKTGIFKHLIKYDLNETSNEITEILLELIHSGEYIPVIRQGKVQDKSEEESIENQPALIQINSKLNSLKHIDVKNINSYINSIQEDRYTEFMLNQFYENAASKNYNELVIIIDKLNKNEPIEENDRKILGMYPFILNDPPNIAQINLEKAKKKIDQVSQAFGK
jgi:hypothetical protein